MFSSNGTQVSSAANFIEDVFSTYLYTGTGAALTVTNTIDLSTYGGLVWLKSRSGATDHKLTDTVRGATKALVSNSTATQTTDSTGLTAFGTTGFTVGANTDYNTSASTYVSWAFRKQTKFFDVVTWSGDGTNNRAIPHSLGSVPGCVITHATAGGITNWNTYHRSLPLHYSIKLNTTAAAVDLGATGWGTTGTPTSTVFYVDTLANSLGLDYVAYFFAHDAGGFGLAGTDNVISCGSFAAAGALTYVELGYEPQWVLVKSVSGADPVQNWYTIDTMRGMSLTGTTKLLPNTSAVESDPAAGNPEFPAATGMYLRPNGSGTYIYIAIRRGPMAVPTLGTSVFSPTAVNNVQGTVNTTGFPIDMQIMNIRSGFGANGVLSTRLLGVSSNTTSSGSYLRTPSTSVETTGSDITQYWDNTGFQTSSNWASSGMIYWSFGRAPSCMDVVCYTGTGSATTFSHNLAAVPELMIVKRRSAANDWAVYANNDNTDYLVLNTTAATADDNTYWNDTSPTSSVFSVGTNNAVNASASTYVAYLFATCAGVSKVGSYTGNGTTQTINCGFTGGARFVLIKRTDSTGDWYVYDTARGMTVLTDPYLLLNSNAAEAATLGSVTTVSTGFALNSTILAAINVSAGTYIFLAIA